jgi:glutathione synthase/RimK-type ligase-like ATP-grasp enzyme
MVPPDLVVLHEHPEWQQPLFSALERRGVSFVPFDLKRAAFDVDVVPEAKLYFNQASPSAYLRGNSQAVPFALSLMRCLEIAGARVLNGSRAFALELSKSVQGSLLGKLGVDHPRSLAFNDVEAVRGRWSHFPALLKPEQGGSGARMFLLESFEELERTISLTPDIWLPDQLLILQEYFPANRDRGIVRMEFVGGELLYAMRIVSHGSFNLCPSEVCNPEAGAGACAVPERRSLAPVEFHPFPEVPERAVANGKRIVSAAGLDVAGIEYLEATDGRLVFYDINANSNLRPAIGKAFGFDPFERVVDYLEREIENAKH